MWQRRFFFFFLFFISPLFLSPCVGCCCCCSGKLSIWSRLTRQRERSGLRVCPSRAWLRDGSSSICKEQGGAPFHQAVDLPVCWPDVNISNHRRAIIFPWDGHQDFSAPAPYGGRMIQRRDDTDHPHGLLLLLINYQFIVYAHIAYCVIGSL